jgi:hypothetical protein
MDLGDVSAAFPWPRSTSMMLLCCGNRHGNVRRAQRSVSNRCHGDASHFSLLLLTNRRSCDNVIKHCKRYCWRSLHCCQQYETRVFMSTVRHFCTILTKFGSSWQISVKLPPNIKFHENPSQLESRQTDVQTNGEDKFIIPFSLFMPAHLIAMPLFSRINASPEGSVRMCIQHSDAGTPRLNSIIPSSELLRGVRWFKTAVSGPSTGPIFKGPEALLLHLNP